MSEEARDTAAAVPSEFRLGAAVVAGEIPRSIATGILPLLVGAFVDGRGFDEQDASWLTSGELLGVSLGAFAIAGRVARSSRAALCVVGFAIAAAGQAASLAHLEFAPLFALRFLSGFGAGIAGAAAVAGAAASRDPERLFAAAGVVVAMLGALVIVPIGALVDRFEASGVFGVALVLTAVSLPFVRWLPAGTGARRRRETPLPNLALGVLMCGALFATAVGQYAVWGFTERIGREVGLDTNAISLVISATAVAGLVGGGAAAALGTRFGRSGPLLGSIVLTVVAVVGLVEGRTVAGYWIANAVWMLAFTFSLPYFMGALAALDRGGAWTAIGLGVTTVGGAVGPAVGGSAVSAYGYSSLSVLMVVCGALSIAFAAIVLGRLDDDDGEAAASVPAAGTGSAR